MTRGTWASTTTATCSMHCRRRVQLAWFGEDPEPDGCSCAMTSTWPRTPRCAWRSSKRAGRHRHLFPDDRVDLLQPRLAGGRRRVARLRGARSPLGLHAVYPNAALDDRFEPVVAWHNPEPAYLTGADPGRGQRDGGAVLHAVHVPLRLEPALALGRSARRAAQRRVSVAPTPDPPRDLGVRGRDPWARRCARCCTRRSNAASSSFRATRSTCREPRGDAHRRRSQPRRSGRRHGAPAAGRVEPGRPRAAPALRGGRVRRAPRFLGIDEQGREILSFVEGEPGHAPVPCERRGGGRAGPAVAHECTTHSRAFLPRPARRGRSSRLHRDGEVVCHTDLFCTNVVFRAMAGQLALIDWDLAVPGSRLVDVALGRLHCAPLRVDGQAIDVGRADRQARPSACARCATPMGSRCETARCLLDFHLARRRLGYETHRIWGGVERKARVA